MSLQTEADKAQAQLLSGSPGRQRGMESLKQVCVVLEGAPVERYWNFSCSSHKCCEIIVNRISHCSSILSLPPTTVRDLWKNGFLQSFLSREASYRWNYPVNNEIVSHLCTQMVVEEESRVKCRQK